MTMFFGYSWYEANSQRRYPLDDVATGITDDGHSLPHDIIVDLNVCFPSEYGNVAFIGAVQVTPGVRTVVIMAGNTFTDDVMPIASVTVAVSDSYSHRQYTLEPMMAGVAGWLVFGECAIAGGTWRGVFSTIPQTVLAMRVARPYRSTPVVSIGKRYAGANAMTDIVELRAGTNMQIVAAVRDIAGADTEVISFSLDAKMNPALLGQFAGPVGHRPESRTCNKPVIEQLNQVTPDCDGNIELVFDGDCVLVGDAATGQAIDYCLGLTDACTRDRQLPVNGKLPNEYDDTCFEPDGPEPSSPAPPGPDPDPELPSVGMPLMTSFATWPTSLQVVHGSFTLVDNIARSSPGARCMAVWSDSSYWPLTGRTSSVELSLVAGGLENGGMIVGYDSSKASPPYLLVELSKGTSAFRIRYFNGTTYFNIAEAAPLPIVYGVTYRIQVDVTGVPPKAMLCRLYRGAVLVGTLSYHTSLIPDESLIGIHANQSVVDFHSLAIANI